MPAFISVVRFLFFAHFCFNDVFHYYYSFFFFAFIDTQKFSIDSNCGTHFCFFHSFIPAAWFLVRATLHPLIRYSSFISFAQDNTNTHINSFTFMISVPKMIRLFPFHCHYYGTIKMKMKIAHGCVYSLHISPSNTKKQRPKKNTQ